MSVLTPIPPYRLALCAAAAAGIALAAPGPPAQAQTYGYDSDQYATGPYGDVTVTALPRVTRDRFTGAPYRRVRASRIVSYADLDLNARWGVHELRARVERAAQDACDQLEDGVAVNAPNDPPCVSTAVRRAMYQAPIPDYFRDED